MLPEYTFARTADGVVHAWVAIPDRTGGCACDDEHHTSEAVERYIVASVTCVACLAIMGSSPVDALEAKLMHDLRSSLNKTIGEGTEKEAAEVIKATLSKFGGASK